MKFHLDRPVIAGGDEQPPVRRPPGTPAGAGAGGEGAGAGYTVEVRVQVRVEVRVQGKMQMQELQVEVEEHDVEVETEVVQDTPDPVGVFCEGGDELGAVNRPHLGFIHHHRHHGAPWCTTTTMVLHHHHHNLQEPPPPHLDRLVVGPGDEFTVVGAELHAPHGRLERYM